MARWWNEFPFFKGGKDAAEIGVKIAGKSAADIAKEAAQAAKNAGRVEPTLGDVAGATAKESDDAAKASAKAAEDVKNTEKKRSSSYDEQKEINDRLAAAKKDGEKARAGEAPDSAKAKTEEPKADAGPKSKAEEPKAGEGAAGTAGKTADNAEPISWIKARNIARNNDIELNRKLEELVGKGPNAEAWISRAVANARNRGITTSERDAIKDSIFLKEKAPELREKLLRYYDARHPVDPGLMGIKGRISKTTEAVAAPLDYWMRHPINAADTFIRNSPGRALGAGVGVFKVSRAIPAVGITAFAADTAVRSYAASKSDDPEVSANPIREGAAAATRDAGALLGMTVRGTGHVLSAIPVDSIKDLGKELIEDAPKVMGATLEGADQLTRGVTKGAIESYEEQTNGTEKTEQKPAQKTDTDNKKEGEKMGFIGALSDANKVRELAKAGKEKLEKEAAEKAAANTAAAESSAQITGADTAQKPKEQEQELTDEAREAVGKMNPEEKAKYLLTKGSDAFKKGKDKVQEKVEEADLKGFIEKNANDPGALFGAFMGFDKNKGSVDNIRNMGVMAILGHFIWQMIGPLLGGFGFGGGRSGYDRHNQAMASGQEYFANTRGLGTGSGADGASMNARYTSEGVLIKNAPSANNASSGEVRYTADGKRITGNQPAAPVERYYDQGPATPATSYAAPEAAPVTGTPVASAQPIVQVQGNVRTYDAPAMAANTPVVQVNGIERNYGVDTPEAKNDPQFKRNRILEQVPSLG